jgi:hypothetical protein
LDLRLKSEAIEPGMSLDELTRTMGVPPGVYSSAFTEVEPPGLVSPDVFTEQGMRIGAHQDVGWINDDYVLLVYLKDGFVVHKRLARVETKRFRFLPPLQAQVENRWRLGGGSW